MSGRDIARMPDWLGCDGNADAKSIKRVLLLQAYDFHGPPCWESNELTILCTCAGRQTALLAAA